MTFQIITLFPEVLETYFKASILGRAQEKKLIKIKLINLRKFLAKKERADDRPYGGGPGMVLRLEPLAKALTRALAKTLKSKTKVIIFSAAGKKFSDQMAVDFEKKYKNLILVCGHYEGLDDRLKNILKDKKVKFEEVSVGDYVLTGGEVPAMTVVDAISRKIKGVLGKTESLEEKRLGVGVPVYTRPEVFLYQGKRYKIPQVLASGNHIEIMKWRLAHKKK